MVETKLRLEEILTEKQIHDVIKKYVADEPWELVETELRPVTEGLAGFLGQHLKASLRVKTGESERTIYIFIKRIPPGNKSKENFITENKFYTREMVTLQLIEEMASDEGPNPYCKKSLICNENILVMPDLNMEGYTVRSHKKTFDLAHVLVTAASMARFHADFANLQTRRSRPGQPYHVLREFGHLIAEANFQPGSPWLRIAAKLTADMLDAFSSKYTHAIPDLAHRIFRKYEEASASLTDHENTLNVMIHRDLWAHNVMFRYENGQPANAILIDYQCIRYAPPAFDVTMLLYMTTTREFREQNEMDVFHHYFRVFWESVDDATKQRLREMGYEREEFVRWCERSRMAGMCLALGILPYVLMDPVVAQQTFDDPETFQRLLDEDRSAPVVAHARLSAVYRERLLEISEEFVERFVSTEP